MIIKFNFTVLHTRTIEAGESELVWHLIKMEILYFLEEAEDARRRLYGAVALL
jgi:hypothetical protein